MDKYLQLLEEKRQLAIDDKMHWEISKDIPSQYKDEEIDLIIEKIKEEINTYTDCIELYKSMKESPINEICEGQCNAMKLEREEDKALIKQLEEENEKLKINTKILNLIKKKRIDLGVLIESSNIEMYHRLTWGHEITEEEYEEIMRWY